MVYVYKHCTLLWEKSFREGGGRREEGDKACDQFVKSVQVLFILGEEFLELK